MQFPRTQAKVGPERTILTHLYSALLILYTLVTAHWYNTQFFTLSPTEETDLTRMLQDESLGRRERPDA
jgi:hypothetical protein